VFGIRNAGVTFLGLMNMDAQVNMILDNFMCVRSGSSLVTYYLVILPIRNIVNFRVFLRAIKPTYSIINGLVKEAERRRF
jgi:hypothetical protein